MSKIPRMVAMLGATLAALLVVGGAALAQGPRPPHNCFGYEVMLDGSAAPAGTQIVAMVDGESVGSDTVGSDGWSIEVSGQPSMVMFTVNGMAAEGTCNASEGGGLSQVSLSAMTPAEGDSGDLEGDGGSMMDDGEGDGGSMMDDGEGDGGSMMDDGEGDGGSMMDDGEGDGGSMMDDGEGDGGSMMDDGEGDSEFPDTGTGGLAQGGGSSSALYGGIAAALALVALLGGAAVRRRVRS